MIFDKFVDAWDRKDAEAELALFHDDWQFKFHSSGKIMKKGDMSLEDRTKMMDNHDLENRRCLYENDDVLVMHWIRLKLALSFSSDEVVSPTLLP